MGLLWDLFSPAGEEEAALREAVKDTQQALKQAYAGFNGAESAVLVESYIYEIKALESRYSYLQQKLRDAEKETAAVN